ncbi:hypothetical protein L1049_000832 [Liquidambar formosana]|uniref:Uncharacterized protein n=1 Tax=Liquidambar formosana TaxID=63359 RepID=A0AAP0ND33_LIQFO
MLLPRLLLATFIASTCFPTFAFGAALLPNDEVEALREIEKSLGTAVGNLSTNPCNGQWGLGMQNLVKGVQNGVTCDCSFTNNTLCHVISIVLKGESFLGVLPPELVKLPYLQEM